MMQVAMNMIDVVDRLRVVCTRCPAFATIHFRGEIPGALGMMQRALWYSCHGEHFLALVAHRVALARYVTNDGLPDGPIAIADYEMHPLTAEGIDDLHQRLESDSLATGAFLDVLEGFQQRRPARCAR